MEYFTQPSPEHPVAEIRPVILHQDLEFALHFVESAEKLMPLRNKRRPDVRKDISQTKSFPVRLKAPGVCHLVCKITSKEYMRFFSQNYTSFFLKTVFPVTITYYSR